MNAPHTAWWAETRECRKIAAEIEAPDSAVHYKLDTVDSNAKCSEHSASGKSEANAEQQRVNNPRHWLEVPANHLKESEMAAKRKALARS